MAMTVPWQNIALLSVLVNQSQAARLNRAQDVSPELVRQLMHRLIVHFYGVPGYKPVTLVWAGESPHALSRSIN
jgi:hypothetical protein